MPERRRAASALAFLFPLAIGALVWEVAGWWAGFRFLPPFSRVVTTAVGLVAGGSILGPLQTSLLNLFCGYGAAVVSGLALGIVMGRSRTVEQVLAPFLNAFLATPKIALVPILYALFGLSQAIAVVVVFASAFFVIALSTMRGIQTVDPGYTEMATAFGSSERQLVWRILLPGALPLIMAGLRLSMGQAVRAMVSAEMFISVFGLGGLLRRFGGRFDAEGVFAVLLVVIAVALLCTLAVAAVERRLTPWMDVRE